MGKTRATTKLKESWSAFDPDTAKAYLKGYGLGSKSSKEILAAILKENQTARKGKVLELGCGNGQLYETLRAMKVNYSYTGVDFSPALLDAAKEEYSRDKNANFILDDIMHLENTNGRFDFAIYSHVIEMLPSPELSLMRARKLCEKIIIRFFEPPEFEWDTVDLGEMGVGNDKKVPYLRRKMSKTYYQLILHKIDCKHVDIYASEDKDQVHVLNF